MEPRPQTKHVRKYLILCFIVVVIVVAQILALNFYLVQSNASGTVVNPGSPRGSKTENCNSNGSGSSLLEVCALVNYGNDTRKWYNYTNVPNGWNFYNLTMFFTNGNVVSQYYSDPALQEHQVLSINGVRQNATFYWSLWVFCGNDQAWVYSKVGADDIRLTSGEILSWYFQPLSNSDPPVPYARTVPFCS